MYHVLIVFMVLLNGEVIHQEPLVSNEKFKLEQECKDWLKEQQVSDQYKNGMKTNIQMFKSVGKEKYNQDVEVNVTVECTQLPSEDNEDEKL